MDPHVISDKEKKLFSEKLLFMPETFQNIKIKENVKILGKNENKKDVIFGCFNRFSKINDEVIKIWSKILGTNKSAKIFLKSKEFSDIYFKKKIIQKFKHYKINEEQIILDGKEYSRNEFLHLYNKIDIMLDTFPYSGITTSIEGIWMGVPLLTLVGERYYSRIGYSINRNLNLNDWNVFNKNDYVRTALSKAGNYKDLIKLKASLRDRIEASPIFDSDSFAKNFEDLIRGDQNKGTRLTRQASSETYGTSQQQSQRGIEIEGSWVGLVLGRAGPGEKNQRRCDEGHSCEDCQYRPIWNPGRDDRTGQGRDTGGGADVPDELPGNHPVASVPS